MVTVSPNSKTLPNISEDNLANEHYEGPNDIFFTLIFKLIHSQLFCLYFVFTPSQFKAEANVGIAGCLWSRSEEDLVVGHRSRGSPAACEEGFCWGSIQSGEEWAQWALRPVEAQSQSRDPGSAFLLMLHHILKHVYRLSKDSRLWFPLNGRKTQKPPSI